MLRLILQRLLALVPLLFIVSVLTFSFTSLLPSDPAEQAVRVSPPRSPAVMSAVRRLT